MKNVLSILLLVLPGLISAMTGTTGADTGTYKILDYRVTLTPRSDGTVTIEYSQKWLVQSGHIPWITVGTPNANFQIQAEKKSGNAARVYAENYGNWSGVKIELDRDYRAGESFAAGFSIIQWNLFFADQDQYQLIFTPGWYDRGVIDHLQIEVFFFAPLDVVKTSPAPSRIQQQTMIWEKTGLAGGQRFPIQVSFPRTLLPAGIPHLQSKGVSGWVFIIPILFALFIIIAIIRSIRGISRTRSYGPGGIITYGGPSHRKRIYAAGGGIHPKISTGGGGGFGGRSFSCVCACAGCACACACAGGGAAGCDRKLTHRCPLCQECPRKTTCPVWRPASHE